MTYSDFDRFWRLAMRSAYRPLVAHDYDLDPDKIRRLAYAYPSMVAYNEADQPMKLNYGYGSQPFTVDELLVWAERRADAVLTR
jgi:hypothetical protein